MNSFWKDLPALMPEHGMLTLGLSFTFLLIGWGSSISISKQHGWLIKKHSRYQAQPADDVLWIVGEKSKLLPAVTLKPKPAKDNLMDVEMMKRYGLIPIENKDEDKTEYGEDK